jgi:phosphoribosyl 1,2-cyclic phosphodiesterase
MRLIVCGARGSTPSPGAEFVRFGGHTSCVAIAREGADPALVIDGGTGLRRLSRVLEGRPFRGTILLGHLHWDHTGGLPFFASGDREGSQVTLIMPAQGDPAEVFARAIAPPFFPVRLEQLRGDWRLRSLEEGPHTIEGYSVVAREIPHKGGRTFGFRISDGRSTIAYLSDHSPITLGPGPEGFGAYHEAALALAQDADLLFHDGQHTAEEFPAVATFGHSAIDYAIGLAEAAGVRRLALFHHDPNRSDDQVQTILDRQRARRVIVEVPTEGEVIDLGAAAPKLRR